MKEESVWFFERWTQFAEMGGGYHSLDYAFGVIEMSLDQKTNRGEETYIAAAASDGIPEKSTGSRKSRLKTSPRFRSDGSEFKDE